MKTETSPAIKLLAKIEGRHRGLETQRQELEERSRLARFIIIRTNPQLRAYVEYTQAQESVLEARRSAYQNEARDIIF